MAEKNFFTLFKDKMAALRPSEQHRDRDWDALGERLDLALPQQPNTRRRGLVLPILIAVALLSSNAAWWQSGKKDQKRLAQLEAQTALLQKNFAELGEVVVSSKTTHKRDTVWRTVYVTQRQIPNNADLDWKSTSEKTEPSPESINPVLEAVADLEKHATNVSNNLNHEFAKPLPAPIDLPEDTLTVLETQVPRTAKTTDSLTLTSLEEKKPTKPFAQKLGNALRPKFFKIGVQTAWLLANSKGLMHQGGYSFGMQAQLGLSRHWALNVAHTMSRFHYKAEEAAAVMGAPSLPMLPSSEHHYTEMDVTGQRTRQWDLGLRYTFSQPGKARTYLGIGWAAQTLMPFSVEYEIQHEASGTIEKGVHQISTKTRLRNCIGLNVGLELPMTKRLNLTLEGFYQRQWKKPSTAAPDLTGLRAGVHWLF